MREIVVPPEALQEYERVRRQRDDARANVERLQQRIELKEDQIAVRDEIIQTLREQLRADKAEHQLRGALSEADLKRVTQPRG